MVLKAQELDRRVSLQHLVKTRDASTNEEIETYVEYAKVWARKFDLRGREFFAAQQVNSDITTNWRIRYNPDVVATDRLVHNGLEYDITGIAEISRIDGMELQATAVRP